MPLFLLTALLVAFQQQEPLIQERFTVNYVMLDVMAYRSGDTPVEDLKLSDFVVTENRKKVKLTTFQIIDYDRARVDAVLGPEKIPQAGQARQTVAPAPNPRSQYILVLDLESASLAEVQKTFAQLNRLMDDIELDREVAILVYSMKHGLITPDFLEDPTQVREVLASYRHRYVEGLEKTLTSGRYQGPGQEGQHMPVLVRNLGELEKKFEHCRNLFERKPVQLQRCIDEELEAFLEIQGLRVERVIGELEALTYRFQEFDGLKTMLFISPGFSLEPGRAGADLARYFKHAHRGSTIESEDRFQSEVAFAQTGSMELVSIPSYEKEFRKVVHACTRNRVIFNTIDIYNFGAMNHRRISSEFRGNLPQSVLKTYQHHADENSGGLQHLAEESGGRFFQSGDLTKALTKLLTERQYIYVLGYQSPAGKPGAFRKIKVKCKRRGVKLRYRNGYFGR